MVSLLNFFTRNYCRTTQYFTMKNLSKLNKVSIANFPEIDGLFKRLINQDGLKFLNKKFNEHNYEIRIAGGAIRDLLCKKFPDDVDIATVATPDQMIQILDNLENVRLIQTQAGKKHGTIIVRVNNTWQYELTTLRIDCKTDGRHAEVEFIKDWNLDASRRDLTINSMFLGFDGTIYDYFNGIEHLKEKKVLFVGDPKERIIEDYLRILRYFRFYVRYGNLKDHDKYTAETIINYKDGLKSISGERKWTEMKKIIFLPNSSLVIESMFNYFFLHHYMGFNEGKKKFEKFYQIKENLKKFDFSYEKQLYPIILFTSLIEDVNELLNIRNTLKLSNNEMLCSNCILSLRDSNPNLKEIKKMYVLSPKSDLNKKREQLLSYLMYVGDLESYQKLKNFDLPDFPNLVKIVQSKVTKSNEIGIYLRKLKEIWTENDFEMTKEDLIKEFNQLLENK